jgi:hypothetical protein
VGLKIRVVFEFNRMSSEMQTQAYELVMPVRRTQQRKPQQKSALGQSEKQMRKPA